MEYWRAVHCEQKEKFHTLYYHACNLAEDRDAMKEVEEKNKETFKQQVLHIKHLNDRVASLVHVGNMDHLARQQNISTYSMTDSLSDTTQDDKEDISVDATSSLEPITTNTRYIPSVLPNLELQQVDAMTAKAVQKDQAYIAKITKALVKLEKKYKCPPEKRNPNKFKRKVRKTPIIPKEFTAIYHLLCAPDPDPVFVPDLMPQVNWSRLNKHFMKNLPTPETFRIHSCPQDPNFYKRHRVGSCVPFGTRSVIMTNLGVVGLPSEPVHGYVWQGGEWTIHATIGRG